MAREFFRWLPFLLFNLWGSTVSASPQLVARQDLWPDSSIPAIFGGAAAVWGVGQSIIDNLLFSPSPSDQPGAWAPPKEPATTPLSQPNPPQRTWPQNDPSNPRPNAPAPQYEESLQSPVPQGGWAVDDCEPFSGNGPGDVSPSLKVRRRS